VTARKARVKSIGMYKVSKEHKHLRGNLSSEIRESFTGEVVFALALNKENLPYRK